MDINVTFTHARSSTPLEVDLDNQLTAKDVITHLLLPLSSSKGPFLSPLQPGQRYLLVLRRTGTIIPTNVTLENAGTQDKDVLEVVLSAKAA